MVSMTSAMFLSQSIYWNTPKDLFLKLNEEFNFDLDAAANEKNKTCEIFLDEEINSLTVDWHGKVFCNPPYSRNLHLWLQKAHQEISKNATVIVMLLPARTDTKWFHDFVLNKCEIRFIKGRLRFSEHKMNAPFPSMIVIFKKIPDDK